MDSRANHAEHPASPASSSTSATPAERTSFQSHARTISTFTDASGSLKSNRFSMQFPLSGRTSLSETRETSFFDSGTLGAPSAPADGSFLTAIAAQERRVLELKEELQRAEVELDKLKQHWAQHEAKRKRDDVKHVTQLQPLQTSFPAHDREDDIDGSSAWMQQEMDRRKAMLAGTKSSNRTVFAGSRHTRALSLLSPKESVHTMLPRQLPPRRDSLRKPAGELVDRLNSEEPGRLIRSATTMSSFAESRPHSDQDISLANKSLDHEALLRQGKKMATDLKDGLWTFWEDLRQATVGEEATTTHPKRQSSSQTLRTARKQSSKNSLRASSRGSSVSKASTETKRPPMVQRQTSAALPDLANPSFWSEHGTMSHASATTLSRNGKASGQDRSPGAKRHSLSSNDAWDTWDESPAQSRASSSVASEYATTLPSTVSESPRTSTSTNRDLIDFPRKEPIPWPAIRKAGTATLRRTASHLMQEWENLERALTPVPGEEFTGNEYLVHASAETPHARGEKIRAE